MNDESLKLDLAALRDVLRDLAAYQEASTNARHLDRSLTDPRFRR